MHIALHVSVSWTSSFKLYVHSITSDFSTALQHMEKRSAHLPGVTVGLVLFSPVEIVLYMSSWQNVVLHGDIYWAGLSTLAGVYESVCLWLDGGIAAVQDAVTSL